MNNDQKQIIQIYPQDTGGYKYQILEDQDDLLRNNTSEEKEEVDGQRTFLIFEGIQTMYNVRTQLLENKATLKRISFKNVLLKQDFWVLEKLNIQYLSQIESMTMLFNQEDLTIAEYPELNKIDIDITDVEKFFNDEQELKEIEAKKDEVKKVQEQLLYRTYLEMKKEVLDTLDSHLKLKNYMSPEKVIIIHFTFQSMETFNYAYKYLENNFDKIKEIIFRNIKTLRKESFNKLSQVLLKQQKIEEISFEYTFLNNFHIQLIRDILGQKRGQITSIRFIQCGLNELDINTLFFSTLYISDFPKLENLEIEKNPLLLNLKQLKFLQNYVVENRKKLAKEGCLFKLEKCILNICSCLKSKETKQYKEIGNTIENFHFFLEPKILIFDNYFSNSNQVILQQILRLYTDQDCCQTLSLKNFNLVQADTALTNLLIKLICENKASVYINLQQTQITKELLTKIAQQLPQNKKIIGFLCLKENLKYIPSQNIQTSNANIDNMQTGQNSPGGANLLANNYTEKNSQEEDINNKNDEINEKNESNKELDLKRSLLKSNKSVKLNQSIMFQTDYWKKSLNYLFCTSYSYIKNLSLENCRLDDQDIITIAEGIAFHSKEYTNSSVIRLESLNLSYNSLQMGSAKLSNKSIQISKTENTKNCVQILIETIFIKTQLDKLIMIGCGIDKKQASDIQEQIKTSYMVKVQKEKKRCMGGNQITSVPHIKQFAYSEKSEQNINLKLEQQQQKKGQKQENEEEFEIDIEGINQSRMEVQQNESMRQSKWISSKMKFRSIKTIKNYSKTKQPEKAIVQKKVSQDLNQSNNDNINKEMNNMEENQSLFFQEAQDRGPSSLKKNSDKNFDFGNGKTKDDIDKDQEKNQLVKSQNNQIPTGIQYNQNETILEEDDQEDKGPGISEENMIYMNKKYADKRQYSLNNLCSILNMIQPEYQEEKYFQDGFDIIQVEIYGKKTDELKQNMEKQKPKDFFEQHSLNLKSLKFHPEKQEDNKPDKFYFDIINGVTKGYRSKLLSDNPKNSLTNDTCSIPLVYFNISDCNDIPQDIVKEFTELMILESDAVKVKTENDNLENQGKTQNNNKNYQQMTKQQLNKLKNLYFEKYMSIDAQIRMSENTLTKNIEKMNKTFFLKIDKIIIENNSLNTKPEVIGNVLSSVGWAAGPYLTKIECGNLELDSYSNELSDNFKYVHNRLIKYRETQFIPQELKLNKIENFPTEFVKTFITVGSNGRVLKIINGQAMFYDLQQMFIELIKQNAINKFLLESFIFHYKSCFGIGADERSKLIKSLTFKGSKKKLKYIDILDIDEIDLLDNEQKLQEIQRRKDAKQIKDNEKDLAQINQINQKYVQNENCLEENFQSEIDSLVCMKEQRNWITLKKIELSRGDVSQGQAKKILKLNEELNLYRVEINNFFNRKQDIIDCFVLVEDNNEEFQEDPDLETKNLINSYKDAIIKEQVSDPQDVEKLKVQSFIFDHNMFKQRQGQGPWQLNFIDCNEQDYLCNKKEYDQILYNYSKDSREERIQLKMICNEYPYIEEFCAALQSRFKKNKLKLSVKIEKNDEEEKQDVGNGKDKSQSLKSKTLGIAKGFKNTLKKAKNKLKKGESGAKRIDTFMKYILACDESPTELYIDSTFVDDFMLGCLGIYPDNHSKYSYLLNNDFFKLCENPKIKLVTKQIHFIPNILDNKFDVLGGNDLNYIYKINKYIKMTNIGILVMNYSYISSDPLKEMAKLSKTIGEDKQKRKNELLKEKRIVKRQIKKQKDEYQKIQFQSDLKTIDKRIKSLEDDFIQPPNSEYELIELFQRIPPSKVEIKNLSINALKILYVISYENPNFQSAIIEYDSQALVNNGVAYSLQDYFVSPQMSKSGINIIKYFFKSLLKGIFGFFVSKDVIYKFDESVISLNSFLDLNKRYYISMMIMILIYWFIGSFCPIYFTYRDGILQEKNRGVSWTSHIIWAIFFFVTVIMETYLYVMTLKKMAHLTPSLKLSPGDGFITYYINYIKKKVINLKWFNYQYLLYGKNLWRSQNARFDFYSDVSFVVACLQNDFKDLAYMSAAVLGLTILHNFMSYLSIIKDNYVNRDKPKLGTHHINKFYESAVFLEFVALGDVLDVVSPYNVVGIPNNRFTRFFLPGYCGQSISRKMINTASRIFLEDIPQIILQSIYMSRTTEENYMIWVGFGSSLLSIIDSLGIFLSTRPSIITQMDFDRLSYRRQADKQRSFNSFKQKQGKMYKQIRNSYYDATGTVEDDDEDIQ